MENKPTEEKAKLPQYELKKDFVTDKKTYKRGEKYSNANADVIAYLKTNQYI